MLVLVLYYYFSLSACHTGKATTRTNGPDQDTIEKTLRLLAIHMKSLSEGEGPSNRSKDTADLADSAVVLIYRIPMDMATRRSPLAPYIQIRTAQPLQAHSTDSLKSVQSLTPMPLDMRRSSILHTEMKFWTRLAF